MHQCAIVTGGESGIEKACALALGRHGTAVVRTYLENEAAGEGVARQIVRDGGRAIAAQADVSDEASVDRLFTSAEAEFGLVRFLVNAAGLNMRGIPIADMTLARFDRVLRTDLHGPFLTCRRFVRGLLGSSPGGRIVNISSIHEGSLRARAGWNTTALKEGWPS